MEANEERNALAELADRMFSEIDGRRLIEPNREDYDTARRIVAELAKVLDERTYGNRTFYLISSADAVEKCRAIAEEGANHE